MGTEPFYVTLAISIASHLTEKILAATGRRIRDRFSGDETRQALTAAIEEALELALASFHLEQFPSQTRDRL